MIKAGGIQTQGEPRDLLWPLVAAFVVRIAMLPFAAIDNPRLWEYGEIARNLLAGHGYSMHWQLMQQPPVLVPTAFMPPGTTMIHLFGLWLFGDQLGGYLAIFFIQVFCGVGFVYFSAKLVDRLFQYARLTQLSAWSAALYPAFVFTSATFGVATEALFLNALFIYAACLLWVAVQFGGRALLRAFLLGLVAGVLTLFRAEAPLTIACTAIYFLVTSRHKLKESILAVAIVGVVMLAVIIPWTVRNVETFQAFIPGSTSGGLNLWKGNNPLATGSGWNASGGVIAPTDTLVATVVPSGVITSQLEVEESAMLSKTATEWIRKHPSQTILLDIKKVAMLWLFDWYNPESKRAVYIALALSTLAVAVFGMWSYAHSSSISMTGHFGMRLISIVLVVNTVTAMIFFVAPRYQIFLMGVYWPFVVLGIDRILGLRKRSEAGSLKVETPQPIPSEVFI